MKKLRVAVVGCGSISTIHLTPISVMDNAVLVGVCDIKEDVEFVDPMSSAGLSSKTAKEKCDFSCYYVYYLIKW